jgi:hypothetical protein
VAMLPSRILVLFVCLALSSASAAIAAQEAPKENPRRTDHPPVDADGRMSLLEIRKVCDEDIKKMCPDIRPGGGRIVQCLHGHQSNLTAGCRQFLTPRSPKP